MAALLSSWSGWWSGKGSEGEKEDGEKEEGGKEEGEKEEGEKEEGEKKEGGSTTESWSAGIGSKKLLGRLWTCHMIWLLKGMPKNLFFSLGLATSISPCSYALVQVLSAVWGTTPLR